MFEVYDATHTSYACTDRDLKDQCGDADGCYIVLRMQIQVPGYHDMVRSIGQRIYMEQPNLSSNVYAGLYGHTRQEGGSESDWILGIAAQYELFGPYNWAWAHNFKHGYCPGRQGVSGPSFQGAEIYRINFMTSPHIRTLVTIYDN
jgi:hypothetical protein